MFGLSFLLCSFFGSLFSDSGSSVSNLFGLRGGKEDVPPPSNKPTNATVNAGDDATSRQLRAELTKWIFVPSANATSSVTTWVRVNAIPASSDAPARVLSANAGPAPDRLSKPAYPAHAQRKGYEGVAVLEVVVGADGAVSVRET